MKDELKSEIIEDFDRAKNAFASAKRNFEEEDMFTAANRYSLPVKMRFMLA